MTAAVYAVAVLLAVATPPLVFWIVLVIVAALGLAELTALRRGRSWVALGALFLVGLTCLGALRQIGAFGARHGTPIDLPVWLILAILPTWAADVAAYLVGSAFGRRRLAPRISPGKTWEGTIAGSIASAAVAIGVGMAFGLGRVPVTIVAAGLGPIGLAGDLLESYVKRRTGVKDSGTMLPGHGGILDRLDSLTAAAALVFLVLAAWSVTQLGTEGGLFERF